MKSTEVESFEGNYRKSEKDIKWEQTKLDEIQESMKTSVDELKTEVRLLSGFQEEMQDSIEQLDKRNCDTENSEKDDIIRKGKGTIKHMTLLFNNFKSDFKQHYADLPEFTKIDMEFQDLVEIFKMITQPSILDDTFNRNSEDGNQETSPGLVELNNGENLTNNEILKIPELDIKKPNNDDGDKYSSTLSRKRGDGSFSIHSSSDNKNKATEEFNKLIEDIDTKYKMDDSARNEIYEKLYDKIFDLRITIFKTNEEALNNSNNTEKETNFQYFQSVTQSVINSKVQDLKNIDYQTLGNVSKETAMSWWGKTSDYVAKNTGGWVKGIKASLLSKADEDDDDNKDQNMFSPNSKGMGNFIFYGKGLRDTNLDNPNTILAAFPKGVDILTNDYEFNYDETMEKIGLVGMCSIFLDYESDNDNYQHAIVQATPNYAVSFNMNYGLNEYKKFKIFLEKVLKNEMMLKIVFGYKQTCSILGILLNQNKLEINGYHDIHCYTEYESNSNENLRYFTQSTGSDMRCIRPMANRYLGVEFASKLPNWVNEDRCGDIENTGCVFARGQVMIEIYKFFSRNKGMLDIQMTTNLKQDDLVKEGRKYIADIYYHKGYQQLKSMNYQVFPPVGEDYSKQVEQAEQMGAQILTTDIYFANLYWKEGKCDENQIVLLLVL